MLGIRKIFTSFILFVISINLFYILYIKCNQFYLYQHNFRSKYISNMFVLNHICKDVEQRIKMGHNNKICSDAELFIEHNSYPIKSAFEKLMNETLIVNNIKWPKNNIDKVTFLYIFLGLLAFTTIYRRIFPQDTYRYLNDSNLPLMYLNSHQSPNYVSYPPYNSISFKTLHKQPYDMNFNMVGKRDYIIDIKKNN
jgi:hypothetical protein